MRKTEIPEVLVRSVMSVYEIARMSQRIMSCQEFEDEVEMHQGSMLSLFLFAVVMDVITEFDRGCTK